MHSQPIHLPRAITSIHQVSRSPFHKGSKSKTHKGDKDFTTKKGSADFDEDHHFIRRDARPFSTERLRPSKHKAMHSKNTRGFSSTYTEPKPRKAKKGAKSTTGKGAKSTTDKGAKGTTKPKKRMM